MAVRVAINGFGRIGRLAFIRFNPSTFQPLNFHHLLCISKTYPTLCCILYQKFPMQNLAIPRFCMRRFSPTTTPCHIKKSRPCVLAGGGLIGILPIGRSRPVLAFPSRESRQSRKEGDILHNHGLHGERFLLLHALRKPGESEEDEQREQDRKRLHGILRKKKPRSLAPEALSSDQ